MHSCTGNHHWRVHNLQQALVSAHLGVWCRAPLPTCIMTQTGCASSSSCTNSNSCSSSSSNSSSRHSNLRLLVIARHGKCQPHHLLQQQSQSLSVRSAPHPYSNQQVALLPFLATCDEPKQQCWLCIAYRESCASGRALQSTMLLSHSVAMSHDLLSSCMLTTQDDMRCVCMFRMVPAIRKYCKVRPVHTAKAAFQRCVIAGVQGDAGKQASAQQEPVTATEADAAAQRQTDQQQSASEGSEATPVAHAPTTSASGMSLQPPSLPAHFAQQQQQQQQRTLTSGQLATGVSQVATGNVQQQQQAAGTAAAAAAAAANAASGSPREGAGGQKAAPKPPLAPGSKSVPQVTSHTAASCGVSRGS